jgi:hypothetical protein
MSQNVELPNMTTDGLHNYRLALNGWFNQRSIMPTIPSLCSNRIPYYQTWMWQCKMYSEQPHLQLLFDSERSSVAIQKLHFHHELTIPCHTAMPSPSTQCRATGALNYCRLLSINGARGKNSDVIRRSIRKIVLLNLLVLYTNCWIFMGHWKPPHQGKKTYWRFHSLGDFNASSSDKPLITPT